MANGNVKSLELERFRKRLDTLIEAGKVEDGPFADAIYQAVAAHGIPEDDFRDTFGLTGGAVDRWTMGKNLPQPSVRTKILRWIKENL